MDLLTGMIQTVKSLKNSREWDKILKLSMKNSLTLDEIDSIIEEKCYISEDFEYNFLNEAHTLGLMFIKEVAEEEAKTKISEEDDVLNLLHKILEVLERD